jgi:site-specific DNA-methyltransferase (adenine-specific)
VTPYYSDDLVTIYHGDCREWLPDAEAIVTDPPYGMGWDTDSSRFSGGLDPTRRGGRKAPRVVGDDEPFDPRPWLRYSDVILWGANHYGQLLPRGTTLVWLKRLDAAFGTFLSDAEIAWQKGGHGVYCFRDLSLNAETSARHHPTQKPVSLLRWCVAKTEGTVLDPFMGSGTTLVAAKSLGRKAIGIEIEERYCEIAARRCSQEVLGLSHRYGARRAR